MNYSMNRLIKWKLQDRSDWVTIYFFIICSVHRPVLIDALPLQSSQLNYELSKFILTISHNPFQLPFLGFSCIYSVSVIITSLLYV